MPWKTNRKVSSTVIICFLHDNPSLRKGVMKNILSRKMEAKDYVGKEVSSSRFMK